MLGTATAARRLLDARYFNRHVRPVSFSRGDLVLVFDFEKANTYLRKLAPPWVGPGKIVRQVCPKVFDVLLSAGRRLCNVHSD